MSFGSYKKGREQIQDKKKDRNNMWERQEW